MIKRLVELYSLIFTTIITISAFVSITNPADAVFPLILLPLILYFLFEILNFKKSATESSVSDAKIIPPSQTQPTIININHFHPAPQPHEQVHEPQVLSDSQVKDIDRRLFLKLIGSAGLTTFLFSIFTSKSHAAFFGSVPGPGTVALKDSSGNQIDPAEKHPTDGYNITQIDDIGPTYNYYGFVNKLGYWYIQRETASGGSAGDFRYVKGTTNFTTNWTNRSSLTYDYFDNVF